MSRQIDRWVRGMRGDMVALEKPVSVEVGKTSTKRAGQRRQTTELIAHQI